FDARLHSGTGGQSIRLVDNTGICRRVSPWSATPGPILMLAAFIGFKLAGATGAAVAGSAIFLPAVSAAATPEAERPSMAAGIYAWCWTCCDRRALRLARANGSARCPRSLCLGSSRADDRDHSAVQPRAVAANGGGWSDRSAEQRQRNKRLEELA